VACRTQDGDEGFPRERSRRGLERAVHGQKSYNGVAILSKATMEDVTPRLPTPAARARGPLRYLESGRHGRHGVVRVARSIAPTGILARSQVRFKAPARTDCAVHAKKLDEERGACVADGRLQHHPGRPRCPTPKAWVKDALFSREAKAALGRIENLGNDASPRASRGWVSTPSGIIRVLGTQ